MWQLARDADIACRIAIARSVSVAAEVVGRSAFEIEALLKARGFRARRWSNAERELLRTLLCRYNIQRCASLLGRLPEEIAAEAERLGILDLGEDISARNNRKHWTDEEKKILRRMRQNGKAYEEIARVLNRSTDSVKAFAERHGMGAKVPRWTQREDDILRQWFGRETFKKTGERLGKSEFAIYKRAKRLGLVAAK